MIYLLQLCSFLTFRSVKVYICFNGKYCYKVKTNEYAGIVTEIWNFCRYRLVPDFNLNSFPYSMEIFSHSF